MQSWPVRVKPATAASRGIPTLPNYFSFVSVCLHYSIFQIITKSSDTNCLKYIVATEQPKELFLLQNSAGAEINVLPLFKYSIVQTRGSSSYSFSKG